MNSADYGLWQRSVDGLAVKGGIRLSHDARDVRVARFMALMLSRGAAFYDLPDSSVLVYALKVTAAAEPEPLMISEIQVSAVRAPAR